MVGQTLFRRKFQPLFEITDSHIVRLFDLAAFVFLATGDDVQERRFAAAVRPDQPDFVAGKYLKRHISQHRLIRSKMLSNMLNGQQHGESSECKIQNAKFRVIPTLHSERCTINLS